MDSETITVGAYLEEAEAWLAARAERRTRATEVRWGEGSDDVSVFRSSSGDEERRVVGEARAWQRLKSDAGYGSISWPVEYGGAGLSRPYELGFRRLEREFAVPPSHEAVELSLNIEAPTILALGSEAQRKRYVESLRRADELCCQLFSEPAAGSDLGAISTHAEPDGDDWVINGQKVWTSGAQFADIGYLLARTSSSAARQSALTAFVVPMGSSGVEVRPLRQMTGGSSFNEVFLTDVRVHDDDRLGAVGDGWRAAMTTLGFERTAAAGGTVGGTGRAFELLVLLARRLGRDVDPIVRQELARLHSTLTVRSLTNRRAREAVAVGHVPGPEGSLGKLAYTNSQTQLAKVASLLLGPSLIADTAEWGTYSWSQLVLGAPGMRIAGGTDEIQRNTIAQRVLGLPQGPR